MKRGTMIFLSAAFVLSLSASSFAQGGATSGMGGSKSGEKTRSTGSPGLMGTTNPDNPDNATSRSRSGVREYKGKPSQREQQDRESRGQGRGD